MCGLRTICVSVLVLIPGLAFGFPRSPSERAQVFATCAGRYSALAEHQRLFDGLASERAEEQKKYFESLLEAVMPDALDWGMPGHMALDWRLTAKHAQAQLLHKAAFQPDRDIARRAEGVAEQLLADCRDYMLGA